MGLTMPQNEAFQLKGSDPEPKRPKPQTSQNAYIPSKLQGLPAVQTLLMAVGQGARPESDARMDLGLLGVWGGLHGSGFRVTGFRVWWFRV